jgi:hypothetical protein
MRHRMLTFGFALAATVAVSSPALAEGPNGGRGVVDINGLVNVDVAVQRYPGSGYGGSYGYQNGYREGQREGERDARDNKDYGFKRDDVYEDAERGFRGGSKSAYRADFRRGYEDGYDAGYRRLGGRRGGYPGPGGGYGGGYPDRDRDGIPETRRERIAFNNGYADGLEAGRRDADRRRSFDPDSDSRYRAANRGYSSGYGTRDFFRDEYRTGFRSGYEVGYRAERRDDRRRY